MPIRKILQMPDKRLLQPSAAITEFSAEIKKLIADVVDTRYSGRGPGLAAVQIGEPVSIIAVDPKQFYGYTVLVNAEIINRGKQIVVGSEGCMSIGMGTISFQVKRHQVVTVKFQDRNGVEHTVVAKGFPARLAQHEIDHLSGKMIA